MSDKRWPTQYLNKNGWQYVDICRACWGKGVESTSNKPLAMSKMISSQLHLSTSGQQNCRQNANVGPANVCWFFGNRACSFSKRQTYSIFLFWPISGLNLVFFAPGWQMTISALLSAIWFDAIEFMFYDKHMQSNTLVNGFFSLNY